MNAIYYLTFIAIAPAVFSAYIHEGKEELKEVNMMAQHHFRRAAGSVNRPLKPSLKFRTAPPRAVELNPSQSTVLNCVVSGNPPAVIHWLKDGKRIPMSVYDITHPEIIDDEAPIPLLGLSTTHSRLFIDCVGPRDEGVYTCVAENGFNKTSRKSVLKVTDFHVDDEAAICMAKKSITSPARINMWSGNRLELIGSDAKLFCRSEGLPLPKTTWLGPNNKPIPTHSGRFEVMENGDLVIRNIKWSDMGDYTCQVQNFHAFDSTRTFLYPTQPSDDANE